MNNTNKIQQLYNVCHAYYDLHMSKTGHYAAQEKILNLLIDQICEPILDLACGTGFLMKTLSRKFSLIDGNDFSPEMVKAATNNTNHHISNENAEILGSCNQKYKTIICCNLFFYLQDKRGAINRWANLLDKDGKIVFIEEHPFVKPTSIEMEKYNTELMTLINTISPDDIQNLMTQNGFRLNKEVRTKIDKNHDLYGLVFSLY